MPTLCTPWPGKKRAVFGCFFFGVAEDCHLCCCAAQYVAARRDAGSDSSKLRGVGVVLAASLLVVLAR